MATASTYYTPLDPTVNQITILDKVYHAWREADRFFFRAEHTAKVKVFKSREALNDFVTALRWRMTLPHWIAVWTARLIAALRLPTPPTAPAAMPVLSPEAECMGWSNAHWNIPIAEQNSPAVTYRGTKRLCEFCAAAYDRSMAITKQREADAKNTHELEYFPLLKVA